jgi:hypothetical protein
MRQYPVFVSEEWAHVLAWDLFVITHPVCPLPRAEPRTGMLEEER